MSRSATTTLASLYSTNNLTLIIKDVTSNKQETYNEAALARIRQVNNCSIFTVIIAVETPVTFLHLEYKWYKIIHLSVLISMPYRVNSIWPSIFWSINKNSFLSLVGSHSEGIFPLAIGYTIWCTVVNGYVSVASGEPLVVRENNM